MATVIALEGYSTAPAFWVKEFTAISDNGRVLHLLIAPPETQPSSRTMRQVRWVSTNLNRLDWEEGVIPHTALPEILKKLTEEGQSLVCHGNIAREWIKRLVPSVPLRDTAQEGRKLPGRLDNELCGARRNDHPGRYCSLAKAKYIKKYLA